MTLQQVLLVRESFHKLLPARETCAEMFYRRLFELDPSLRRLFKGDLKAQGEKFFLMLEIIVGGLHRFGDVVSEVRALGQRHVEYGVLPSHYPTVREALLWMVQEVLGDEFTDETRMAWIEMYDLVSRAMIELSSGTDGS